MIWALHPEREQFGGTVHLSIKSNGHKMAFPPHVSPASLKRDHVDVLNSLRQVVVCSLSVCVREWPVSACKHVCASVCACVNVQMCASVCLEVQTGDTLRGKNQHESDSARC